MKKIMNIIAAAALLLAGASCTKTVINDYVVPSVSSYDFDAEGGSFTIGIEASSASWDASGWDSWIEVEINKEDGTIVLTAQANDTGMPREASVQLVCGEASSEISLSQLHEGFKGNFTDMHEYGDKPVFSKNGRFYATYDVEYLSDGNTAVVIPIIVNAETGEKTVLEGSTEYKDMKAVNNDGTMISISTSLASVVLKNGEPLSLEISGYKNVNVEGFQKAMGMFASNDGVLFGNSTDSGDAKGYIFNIGSQSAVPVSEWLMSQYGIVTDDNRYIMNMSSDGKTLGGWRVESGATGTSYPGWYYIL